MENSLEVKRSISEARQLVYKAKNAQKILAAFSQEKIDTIVESMVCAADGASKRLAELAAEETGFGNWEDKFVKNQFASVTLYEHIKDMKTIGVVNNDLKTKSVDIAVPLGVIAALIPSTNPTSTAIYKATIALKSGNAIVFSPHPSAKNCIDEAVKVVYDAAIKAGAPEGIICCMTELTLEGTRELMSHEDVAMIIATGGEAMVRAAYSSGNPAIGVGPGNAPAFIEKTADVKEAVTKIFASKTFDNGVICASEQSIVVEESSKTEVMAEISAQGGYFLSGEDSEKLGGFILRSNGTMNPQIVGKTAKHLADMAGIKVPENTRILISEQATVGKDNPYSREKLAPILGFYVEESWGKAIDRCEELLMNEGKGHTAVIHSDNDYITHIFSMRMPVSRCLINTPSALGGIGSTTSLLPSLTLGCGAIGGSSTSDNVGPMHLLNIRKVVADIQMAEEKSA